LPESSLPNKNVTFVAGDSLDLTKFVAEWLDPLVAKRASSDPGAA
jgi:hypothetical protein